MPILVDPSHGTGKANMVSPMAKAAIAAGADGIMVHPSPADALCDGKQSLSPFEFKRMMTELTPFIRAVGRSMSSVAIAG